MYHIKLSRTLKFLKGFIWLHCTIKEVLQPKIKIVELLQRTMFFYAFRACNDYASFTSKTLLYSASRLHPQDFYLFGLSINITPFMFFPVSPASDTSVSICPYSTLNFSFKKNTHRLVTWLIFLKGSKHQKFKELICFFFCVHHLYPWFRQFIYINK